MLPNPNPFVKTKTHKQQKEQSEQQEQNSNHTSGEEPQSRDLTLEEQLDTFAELLIDLYLLDQQPTRHEEN